MNKRVLRSNSKKTMADEGKITPQNTEQMGLENGGQGAKSDMKITAERPENVDPMLWDLLLEMRKDLGSIKGDTSLMSGRLNNLEKRVSNVEQDHQLKVCSITKMDQELTELKGSIQGVLKGVTTRKEDEEYTRNLIENIAVRLQRLEIQQTTVNKEITQQKTQSMKRNLIFGIEAGSYELAKEGKGTESSEHCIGIIRQFLREKLSIPDSAKLFITVAHRVGAYKDGKHRPILAQFPIAHEREQVMKNAKLLHKTRHFINQQYPPEIRERTDFVYPVFKSLKENKDTKARIVKGQLINNGVIDDRYIPPVLTSGDLTKRPRVDIKQSKTQTAGGSYFRGYAVKMNIGDRILDAKQSLLRSFPESRDAHHIVVAYRLNNGPLGVMENFDSDNDYGVGLELLKKMKQEDIVDTALFATRHCGINFKHIGTERFKIINELCMQAYDLIKD